MAIHYDHGKWNNNRSIFLKIGLICSIIFVIIVFQTEIHSKEVQAYDYSTVEDLTQVTPPNTAHPKKELPPPKPPEPKKMVEEIKESIEFIEEHEPEEKTEERTSEVTSSEFLTNDPLPEPTPPPAPAPPLPDEPVDDGIFISAERMPTFTSCINLETEKERRKCTEETMLEFIYKKLKYPPLAAENGIGGTVVVSFVITKTGDLDQVELMRDLGHGCGLAVTNVIEQLPKWVAGKQNGRPVNVQYRIPVKFESR